MCRDRFSNLSWTYLKVCPYRDNIIIGKIDSLGFAGDPRLPFIEPKR
jgi:hypothetical protein